MLILSKEHLATEDMFNLLKTVIKNEYMPKTFEEFEKSFVEPTFEEIQERNNRQIARQEDVKEVQFVYEPDRNNSNAKFLPLLFFSYGLSSFRGNSKEKLPSDKPNLIELFNFKYQKLLGDKFGDLDYFEYLKRKNKYTLELFDDYLKENKPKFGLFDGKAKKEYKDKVKNSRAELETAYKEHLQYIENKLAELSK